LTSTSKPKRVTFSRIKKVIDYPDFLEVQLRSFQDFMQVDTPPDKRKEEGLYKVFKENFPITDARENFVLEFLDYYIDPPRTPLLSARKAGLTHSVALKAKLFLYCTDPENEDFEPVTQEVYLGNIPYMSYHGTFIINGAERVVVKSVAPFTWCLLWTIFPRQRHQVVFCPDHSFQRFLD
jgi:DNA-directed RNA polymerase subunit beta